MPLMWWDFQTFFWNHNEPDSLRYLISLLLLLVSPSLALQMLCIWVEIYDLLWETVDTAPFTCAATSVVITLPCSVTSVQGSCFSMSAWCVRSLKWLADWHHIASLSNWNSPGFIYFQFLQTAQYKLNPDLRLVTHMAYWDLWHFSWERHIIGGVLPQTLHFWRTKNMTNDGNSHFFAMWALGQCIESELHPLQKREDKKKVISGVSKHSMAKQHKSIHFIIYTKLDSRGQCMIFKY